MEKRKTRYYYFTINASKLSVISKIVIVILVFGLVINHINMAVFANVFEKPTETIISDQSITEISEFDKQELVDEKTKYSKTYRLDNGLCETEIYNKSVHYLDNGQYVNIDNTLIEHDNCYQNNKNAYLVTFPKSLKSNEIEINYLDQSLKLYYDNIDSTAILDKDVDRSVENLQDFIYYPVNEKTIIKYDILNESLKENIILSSYIDNFSYSFFLETDLSLQNQEDKLYFYNDDELVFLFDNYLMYDKDYTVSYDIQITINQINETTYKINVIPSNEYLENASYPVTIDPEIHIVDGGLIDGIVTLYEVDKSNNTSTFKSIGSFNVNNRVDSTTTDDLVALFNIYIPRYYNTNISELLTRNQLMYANLQLTTLSTNAQTDSYAILKYGISEIDRVSFHNSAVFNHNFNIIDALGDEMENYISSDLYFNLELSVSGANNTNVNYSLGSDLTGNKPIITLGYLDEAGLSDYYTYESFPMNNESNLYVAHNSGNLTYVYEDYVSDNLLSLSHIYNTNRLDDSIYGSGFNINYNEYIIETYSGLKLYKGNGKTIEFINTNNNEYLSKEGTGDLVTKVYNGATLIGYERKSDNTIYVYNGTGRLINIYLNENDRVNGIWDTDAKCITITYNNGVISKIEDSYGNYMTLSYSSSANQYPTSNQLGVDYLDYVCIYVHDFSSNNTSLVIGIEYEYQSGKLTRISKEYTTTLHRTYLEYNNRNQVSKIRRNDKGYTFSYDNRNRINKVKVYNGNLTNGDYLDFSYNKNGKETYVTNSKGEETKYSFDNFYHTVKQENPDNYTTFYRYYDIYQDNIINYNLNHKIINQSNSFKNISNIITNHGFEVITNNSIYGWTKDLSGTSSASIEANNILYGSNVLKLYKGIGRAEVYQDIIVSTGKEYIISCFIKNTNSGSGAYLDVVGLDGVVNYTSKSNNIKETDDFIRYEYKFTSNFTGRVRIKLINESGGNAYFDNINVSQSYIDTRYNYLENSSFEKGTTGWSGTAFSQVDNDYFDSNSGDKSFKLALGGEISQTVSKTGLTGDTFVFGGYAKYENYTGSVTVSITFNYLNGSHTTYSYTYNNPVDISEYYMIKAEALSDYLSITLSIENYSLSSYAFIDNFSLYNENYGINISYNTDGKIATKENEITDSLANYEYDNDGKLSTITIDGDDTNLSYDARGNISQIENKNVTTSFEVDNDDIIGIEVSATNSNASYRSEHTTPLVGGLYPTQSEDILGNITTTTYDYLTGLVTNIIDSNGRFTNYSYNDIGEVLSETTGYGNDTKSITYTYDTNGNITSITTGNCIYTFTYNSFNDLTSIALNNSSIVTYNYDNNASIYRGEVLSEVHSYGTINFDYYDNGLVKSISHGNTKVLEYIYNDYGEIAYIIDYKENVTYYYNYDYQNRLINVNATNGNNITYEYDDESRLVNITNLNGTNTYTYSDVSTDQDIVDEKLTNENISNIFGIDYNYTNDDYSNLYIISFYINNSLILKKKYTQEKTFIDNEYYYTGRISEIEYTIGSDIIEYEYVYDIYNNITNVYGYTNNVRTYYEENYYDAFNQITAQEVIVNGLDIISEYYYDYNGNLTGFYSYNNTNHIMIHTGSFNYNNKNEITSYTLDGRTYNTYYIDGLLRNYKSNNLFYDYDKIVEIEGPDDYIYYSYNANGLRISKNVSGIITNYVLNGNNIIKEVTGNNEIKYYYDSNNDVIGFTYYGEEYLYLKNLQNDVIGIVDSSGDIVVKYYYDAYGNIINSTDTSGINLSSINPFRYRSYYYDNETGWYYLNSRYYDPLIKRFITPDDISYLGASGSAISYNLYSYCENNPANMVDYDGNDAQLILDYDSDGLIIAGHMALIVQDAKNNWHLIEFNGTSKKNAKIRIYNGEGRFGKKQGFWKSLLSITELGGWKSLYIKGNFTGSLEYARNNKDKYDGKYCLFTKNCLHFVRDALRQGRCNNELLQLYFEISITIVPRTFFNNAMLVSTMKYTILNKNRIKRGYYA